ncbi:unnamed protein product [Mytilus coruscus]|uniref:HSPA12A n=1 Tax=Mytilus coruscus TaxID=42192 RepID=A0A6J8CCA0_MYTCO|nr:unnamed protein product [Mytilus coruscus]
MKRGGTVEITGHRSKDNKIEELCQPSGCCWGSTKIDEKFLNLIQSIVGEEVMQEMKSKHTDSYFDILREIENFKSKLNSSKRKWEYFKYPLILDTLCKTHLGKSFAEAKEESKFKSNISIKGGNKICLSETIISSFFTSVIGKIVSEIQKVLHEIEPKKIQTFIVVGGLSKSPVLKQKLKTNFPGIKVIVPDDAEMAVSKGAVLYGHRRKFIISRIMQYTYGRLMQPLFDEEKHNPKKRQTIDGYDRCQDCFDILVHKGSSVAVREKIRREYKTFSKEQNKIRVAVYTTQKDGVKYVDEKECELFCDVFVYIPTPMTVKKRTICVEFEFGNTEFNVSAFDKKTKESCIVSKHVQKSGSDKQLVECTSFAIRADIQQLLYCFRVTETHRHFLQFIWYKDNDPNQLLVDYRMTVYVFGNSPSPAVATFGLRRNAEISEAEFGKAVKDNVVRNFYVDDGNRLEQIRSVSTPDQWTYIRADLNPADYGTRSSQALYIKNSPWLLGPDILTRKDVDKGSSTQHIVPDYPLENTDTDKEIRSLVSVTKTNVNHITKL